jgi:hypothetical protein
MAASPYGTNRYCLGQVRDISSSHVPLLLVHPTGNRKEKTERVQALWHRFAGHVLRFYRQSLLWAPLLPLIALFCTCATIHSAILYWNRKGGQWKGRVVSNEGA